MQNQVVVFGGGLVGASFALACAQGGAPVTLVEKNKLEDLLAKNTDRRTTAVNSGSQKWFDTLGIWDSIKPFAQPIYSIRTLELNSAWTLDYNHDDLSENPMGYIVENYYIRKALWQAIQGSKIEKYLSYHATDLSFDDYQVNITLNNGKKLSGSLLVGAEGKTSMSRQNSSIAANQWEYNQQAMVTHVIHEKPHHSTAWEIFTSDGPLAFLPMIDCEQGHCSGIVWAKPKKFKWDHYTTQQLELILMELFPFYGNLSIPNKRWFYPLSAMTVDKIVDHRLALIGDAAHVMHPIAGQGANLGWRDAKILSMLITSNYRLGIDVGNPTLLRHYHRKRILDQKSFVSATDLLHRLFLLKSPPAKFIRQFGFAVINNIKPLKKFFMKRGSDL